MDASLSCLSDARTSSRHFHFIHWKGTPGGALAVFVSTGRTQESRSMCLMHWKVNLKGVFFPHELIEGNLDLVYS